MEELARTTANPEEINIASSGEESEGEEGGRLEEVQLQQQVVPSAVFGSIPEDKQTEVLSGGTGEMMGARQRLAMKRT